MIKKTVRFHHLLLCLSATAVSLVAGPKITVDNADFNVGIVIKGTQKSIKHTFIIKNTGDDTLKIEKVKPG